MATFANDNEMFLYRTSESTLGVHSIRLMLMLWPFISYTIGFRQSKTALYDWILLVLLIVNRVDFIVLVLFLEAVGVREYCCTAVWQSKIG